MWDCGVSFEPYYMRSGILTYTFLGRTHTKRREKTWAGPAKLPKCARYVLHPRGVPRFVSPHLHPPLYQPSLGWSIISLCLLLLVVTIRILATVSSFPLDCQPSFNSLTGKLVLRWESVEESTSPM